MRITDAPPHRPARPPRMIAPLRYADRLTLPVGQKVSAAGRSWEALVQGILSALGGSDFKVVESTLGSAPGNHGAGDGSAGELLAERKVRQVGAGASMRLSIAVLVGAGVGLGALDMYIAGSVVYAVPWIALAGLGAFLLWFRYGRMYQSEVMAVEVTFRPAAQGPAGSEPSHDRTAEVAWRVGRIRSVAYAGSRAAVDVEDCPVALMDALVRAVRRFQSETS